MPTRPAKGARIVRSSSRASAALRWAWAEAMEPSSDFTWAVRSSTCAPVPAPVRLSAWARSSLMAISLRSAVGAVGLGDGLLDLGAPLGGIELDQHVAGLDLLALLEADLAR